MDTKFTAEKDKRISNRQWLESLSDKCLAKYIYDELWYKLPREIEEWLCAEHKEE